MLPLGSGLGESEAQKENPCYACEGFRARYFQTCQRGDCLGCSFRDPRSRLTLACYTDNGAPIAETGCCDAGVPQKNARASSARAFENS